MEILPIRVELIFITPCAGQLIELAGRTCYKSEDRITETSATVFINKLINSGHESVLEHAYASFRIVCDRGITHEIVRHRIASYSQECISGNMKVNRKTTIQELYKKSRYPKLTSCREDNILVKNRVVGVYYKGKAETFRVTSKLGYSIEVTKNHEFKLPDGTFQKLEHISVGQKVLVNGRPSLCQISNDELETLYTSMNPQEIADVLGIDYRSVHRRLHQMGVFQKHKNDKNKEKYNVNHTEDSFRKMRETNLLQYKNGRRAWNKDIREGEHPSVDRQADSLRQHHHNQCSEEKNSIWRGGISESYYLKRVPKGPCQICGSLNATEIHHIDRNRKNNKLSNLIRICINCHDKLHHGWHVGKIAHLDEIISIENVGIQDVYDLEMEAPHHNYIANGFVVHNSSRYCNYASNKFGGSISVIPMLTNLTTEQIERRRNLYELAEKVYMSEISEGIPPQQARDNLPTCLKTEIIMTANFREWRHFLRLRTAKAAHPQMQIIASRIASILLQHCPEAFQDIKFESVD